MTKKTKVIVVGKKIYAFCERCNTLVRLNKWLIGSLHICVDADDEGEKE